MKSSQSIAYIMPEQILNFTAWEILNIDHQLAEISRREGEYQTYTRTQLIELRNSYIFEEDDYGNKYFSPQNGEKQKRLYAKEMEELKKVKRVMQKLDPQAPHEILLILDASIGQNALQQALKFHEAMQVTGLVITKLDGTAKGGIVFAIANRLNLPIRYIGVGEGVDDLIPFNPENFVETLFASEENA